MQSPLDNFSHDSGVRTLRFFDQRHRDEQIITLKFSPVLSNIKKKHKPPPITISFLGQMRGAHIKERASDFRKIINEPKRFNYKIEATP